MSECFRVLHGDFGRVALHTLDHSVVIHAHRQGHLLFKITGPDIRFGVGDREYLLDENGLILLNAWEPHFYKHRTGDHAVTVLEICVEPRWLRSIDQRFLLNMHPRFFSTLSGKVPKAAQEFLEKLTEIITYNSAPSIQQVTTLIHEIAVAIICRFANREGLSSFDLIGGLRCDPRIRKVLSLPDEVTENPITVRQMEQTAGVSRPHFFHLFKQSTQVTPNMFANMVRMETAIRMIATTKSSLGDISLQLGFESPGNFSRFFRTQQGVSPAQYRRSTQ